MTDIARVGVPYTYTMAAEGSAEPIPVEKLGGGSIQLAAAATVLIYGCNKDNPSGETFVQAYDSSGELARVVATAAGIWELPECVYANRFIKLVYASGGTAYVWLIT